jgi:hypothetical protein
LTRLEAADLVEGHPVGVDQEMMIGPRNSAGQMGEDEIIPMEMRDEAIGRRQRHPLLPFLRRDLVTNIRH